MASFEASSLVGERILAVGTPQMDTAKLDSIKALLNGRVELEMEDRLNEGTREQI